MSGQHLYLIQSHTTGCFKVGRSSNPERRLQDLQVGSPHRLKIILVAQDQGWREKHIHATLHGFRSQGHLKGEWFLETALGSLPDDLYEQLDLEDVNTWWVAPTSPVRLLGPPVMPPSKRARHSPPPGIERG